MRQVTRVLGLTLIMALHLFVFTGCGKQAIAVNIETRTLSECLDSIRKRTGLGLEVVTNTPSIVSGFLSNKEGFGCRRINSGTKGLYYHGYFMEKIS